MPMNVIDVLMEEHLHVLMVMAATDGVAQAIRKGAPPDPGFYRKTLHFIRVYAGREHHVKELDCPALPLQPVHQLAVFPPRQPLERVWRLARQKLALPRSPGKAAKEVVRCSRNFRSATSLRSSARP